MEIKEKILKLLSESPQGLTITELSKILEVSRGTATKYIFELKGEGRIIRRRVGSGILHYLTDHYRKFDGKSRKAIDNSSQSH